MQRRLADCVEQRALPEDVRLIAGLDAAFLPDDRRCIAGLGPRRGAHTPVRADGEVIGPLGSRIGWWRTCTPTASATWPRLWW